MLTSHHRFSESILFIPGIRLSSSPLGIAFATPLLNHSLFKMFYFSFFKQMSYDR